MLEEVGDKFQGDCNTSDSFPDGRGYKAGARVTDGLVEIEPRATFLVIEMELVDKEPGHETFDLDTSNEF